MAESYSPQSVSRQSSTFNLQGLDLRLSPFIQPDGEFIRLINVDPYPQGALSKRPGYTTLLGTSTGSVVTTLFDWHKDDGTTFNLYKTSGSLIEYSTQGTGAWTVCGNGTITAGSYVGHTVLNNTLIIGDGVGSTRHTTSGTSFTNTSGAPIGQYFEQYQNRVYIGGTSNTLFYSVTGDPTNWLTTGTSDSSSLTIPGAGKLNGVTKVADRLVSTKNSGVMYRWDGFNLVDMATNLGPSSYLSIGSLEGSKIYLNRRGYFGFSGNAPQILSNSIQPQIYNDVGSAITGGTFDLAPAVVHKYNYYAAVGTVTDDLTREPVTNALQIYNFQYNSWRNYSMGTPVTALWSYKDANLNEQLVFGDNAGQVYTLGGTITTDNGQPIQAIVEYVYHGGIPQTEKQFDWAWFFFNPGCQAHVQVAVSDTWTKEKLNWVDLGDVSDGIKEFHFSGQRGRLLFVKISESSRNARFVFYGMAVQWIPLPK